MPRRRPRKPVTAEARPERPFHAPFGDLKHRLRASPARPSRPQPAGTGRSGAQPSSSASASTVPPAAERRDERTEFLDAVAGVRRLESEQRVDAPPPARRAKRVPVDEEAEALAVLSDLVNGNGTFDVSNSSEYVEGSVVGLDARILRRLRGGQFPYQATLDLHGMSAAAAAVAVDSFVWRAFLAGHRSLLIVHGRGRNSERNMPVLKERLKSWLARGRIRRVVLAFTSARPADGGTGSVYVLLRRRRGAREPMTVFEGARRE